MIDLIGCVIGGLAGAAVIFVMGMRRAARSCTRYHYREDSE
jgi:hypothetical protein